MTAHRNEPEPADPIDRELARHHEAFTAKIEAALDAEAGLRDILLQSRHEAFTTKVETALDVEAGLRDILTPPSIQAPHRLPPAAAPPVANAAPGGSRWQASPAQRLKLRSNPRVAAASRVLHVVGDWVSISPHSLDCARARALAGDLILDRARARALAGDLIRDRDRVCDLARAFARYRDPVGDLDRVGDLARAFALVLDLAHDLASALDRNRGLDLDRTRDLASALGRARALDRALDLARDHDPDLALARDVAVALARDLDLAVVRGFALFLMRDVESALARYLTLALEGALALERALDRALDLARCRCLQIINNEYTQAVGAPVAVDEASLASLMDNFTTDDLSDADVREDDVKLTGVRWSDGTTWPASTDVDRLKRRSDRQEDGSWIIRAGTGNVRDNVIN
ncbi:hypothetical protein QF032_007951 [Streptomyces achromogenes]|uniref:hypothetical protein n=1 Tax=Streptomyces achromogenes TaxID=67255 RepID=UPI00278787D7|nr:hypothetical protein [Streptomyces achromogenes]MDQ0836107.1 hypothetical protein [Streptomyces achromogenes]